MRRKIPVNDSNGNPLYENDMIRSNRSGKIYQVTHNDSNKDELEWIIFKSENGILMPLSRLDGDFEIINSNK